MRDYGVSAGADVYNRHDRVLELARELMLAIQSNGALSCTKAPDVACIVEGAERWIRMEDAYELPEDMR